MVATENDDFVTLDVQGASEQSSDLSRTAGENDFYGEFKKRVILNTMKFSLKNFVQTGDFGSIQLNMQRAMVKGHLGAPESWDAGTPDYQSARFWKYGAVELHFRGDVLEMIFIDDFSVLNTSQSIIIEAWMVAENLTCAAVEQCLSEAKISYRKLNFPYNENGVHLVTNAGVTLAFSGAAASQIHLHSLCCKIEK